MNIDIPEILHGHGLSFKKGVADAILETKEHETSCHETHLASYHNGYRIGETIRKMIAKKVKS